jgi:hypothetical protein
MGRLKGNCPSAADAVAATSWPTTEIDIAVEDVASLPSSQPRKEHHNHDENHSFVAINYFLLKRTNQKLHTFG